METRWRVKYPFVLEEWDPKIWTTGNGREWVDHREFLSVFEERKEIAEEAQFVRCEWND